MPKAPEKIIADMSLPEEGGFWVPADMTPTWDRRETYCRADRVVDRDVGDELLTAAKMAKVHCSPALQPNIYDALKTAIAAYEEATGG